MDKETIKRTIGSIYEDLYYEGIGFNKEGFMKLKDNLTKLTNVLCDIYGVE